MCSQAQSECTLPIVYGAPGAGGFCNACDAPLIGEQLVMSIPKGDTVVHPHAECFMIWTAQWRLRAALAPWISASAASPSH
jgi:hypothetical protein